LLEVSGLETRKLKPETSHEFQVSGGPGEHLTANQRGLIQRIFLSAFIGVHLRLILPLSFVPNKLFILMTII